LLLLQETLLIFGLILHEVYINLLSHFSRLTQALPDHVVRHPLHKREQPCVFLRALSLSADGVTARVHVHGRRREAPELLAWGDALQLRVVIVAEELDINGLTLRVEGLGHAVSFLDGGDLLEFVGLVARTLRRLAQLLASRVVLKHLDSVSVQGFKHARAVVEFVRC